MSWEDVTPAAGRGSRLGGLTANRPRGLVAIEYTRERRSSRTRQSSSVVLRTDLFPVVQICERWQVSRIRNPLDHLCNAIGDLVGIHRIVAVVEHRNARTGPRIEEIRIVSEYDGPILVGERGDCVIVDALGECFVDVFGSDTFATERLGDSCSRRRVPGIPFGYASSSRVNSAIEAAPLSRAVASRSARRLSAAAISSG